MRNLRSITLLTLLFIGSIAYSQGEEAILQYIKAYKELAISEMQRTGVPAAIKLAQGIHETGAGQSILVRKSNNHFGIKCKSSWRGQTVKHTDDAPNECFRAYDTPLESYVDHSDFLRNNSRYASLFELTPTDYKGWAHGLKRAGYATNPKYPQIIISLIEKYDLQSYTLIAMGKKQPEAEILVSDKTIVTPETENRALVSYAEQAEKAAKAYSVSYPQSEFKINDTRVVWIGKGTSFLALAEKYSLPLARIFEFNDLAPHDFATEDQLVFLQRKKKTGNAEHHLVKEGETLHSICQMQGLRMENLLSYNHLKPGMMPAAGSILYLRQPAPSLPALATGK